MLRKIAGATALTLVALSVGAGPAKAAAPITFSLVDLGLDPSWQGTTAVSLSSDGSYAAIQIDRFSPDLDEAGIVHQGAIQEVPSPTGGLIIPTGVNASGVLVGEDHAAQPSGPETDAFAYEAGSVVHLAGLGGAWTSAQAIDDAGTIVGWGRTSSGNTRAVVWDGGSMSDLGSLGGRDGYSAAYAIDSTGEIAGVSGVPKGQIHVALFSGGKITDLTPHLSTDWLPTTQGMNDDGQVVGLLSGSCTGCDVGFLASDGVAGIAWSGAVHDVNDSWELVGTASGPRGILMINGTAYYLDDLLDSSGAGWTIRDARQITEDGMIVGGAQDSSGNLHAVLLVPDGAPPVDHDPPTGTFSIDGGLAETRSPSVTVSASATDPSNIFEIRLSNAPAVDRQGRLASGRSFLPATTIAWSLIDPRTGGSSAGGVKTVYAQWRDWAGNWSAPVSEQITFVPATFTAFSVRPSAFYPRPHDGILDTTKISWGTDRPAIEQVIIRNGLGRVVRRISLGYEGTGPHTTRWNGRKSTGRWVKPGRYRIVVRAAREGYAVLSPVGHVRLRWGSP